MASIVLDASVIAKWFLGDEPDTDQAVTLRRLVTDGIVDASAPAHATLEVVDALRTAARRGRLMPDDLVPAARALVEFDIWVEAADDLPRAARLAWDLGLSVYDALFIALAERTGATLVTADEVLRVRGSAAGFDVVALGELPL